MTTTDPPMPTPSTDAPSTPSTPPPKRPPRGRPAGSPARRFAPTAPPTYLNVQDAATALAVSPAALRARLQRSAAPADGGVRAQLGPGIVGVKVGGSWRIRIDADAAK